LWFVTVAHTPLCSKLLAMFTSARSRFCGENHRKHGEMTIRRELGILWEFLVGAVS
jgi:hypothetical protein